MGSGNALDAADPLVDGTLQPDRLGSVGETLTVDGPAEGRREVPLAELLEGEALLELVDRHAERLDGAPPNVAASLWANYLVTMACPPVLAAWTLFDVGIDAGPGSLALHLEDGLPHRVHVASDAAVRGRPDREVGPRTLLDSMGAVFERLADASGVQREVLDNHVGNLAAYLFDRLDEVGLQGSTPQADREALLDAETLPWGQPNPIRDPVRYETLDADGVPTRYQIRRRCCLKIALEDKTPCASCPSIDAERRVELVRARRASR